MGEEEEFLKRSTNSAIVKITGKRANRAVGYGLELLCLYSFYGDKFPCEWLENKLRKDEFVSELS